MNTTVLNPKTTFLLGGDLDVLHHDSVEMLETIAFWEDELKFFDKLLHRSEPLYEDLKTHKEMLERLENIHDKELKVLKNDILQQEKYLAKLKKNEEDIAEWDYREKHRLLVGRVESMKQAFWAFKKVLFNYVKKL